MGRKNTPKWLIVHHTGGTDLNPLADTLHHTFEVVNNWHKQLWHFKSKLGYYIGYHYFIDKTGRVKQGRDDLEEGAHTIGMNTRSIGICLAGNFDIVNCYPTSIQVKKLKYLLRRLSKKYGIPVKRIVPHRKFARKTCYGRNLSDDWAKELAAGSQIEKLKEKISILEKLIMVYVRLLSLLKVKKNI